MKKIKYLWMLLSLVVIAGCDDFLTTPPLDQITEDSWWKDESQAKMMVDNCYVHLYNDDGDNLLVFRDGFTDNAIWSGNAVMADGSMTAYTGKVKNEWKYSAIVNLNYVLEGLEKARESMSPERYDHMRAEVRFIRFRTRLSRAESFGKVCLI